MSLIGRSLLDSRDLSVPEILDVFRVAELFLREGYKVYEAARGRVMLEAFFEPSTRTRLSFQIAGSRIGLSSAIFEPGTSSIKKGESLVDTFLNLQAMRPDIMVIRSGSATFEQRLAQEFAHADCPIISAGTGVASHPTQALLDAYTLVEHFGTLKDLKVLIFGDLLHSRVARSNLDVLTRLGAKVGVFSPPEWAFEDHAELGAEKIESLEEGLQWCSACMGLRVQLERHESGVQEEMLKRDYHLKYGLTRNRLQLLSEDAVIMHPGPINYGVEFAQEVGQDSREKILTQVKNGVAVRAALLALILGFERIK